MWYENGQRLKKKININHALERIKWNEWIIYTSSKVHWRVLSKNRIFSCYG